MVMGWGRTRALGAWTGLADEEYAEEKADWRLSSGSPCSKSALIMALFQVMRLPHGDRHWLACLVSCWGSAAAEKRGEDDDDNDDNDDRNKADGGGVDRDEGSDEEEPFDR